MEFTSILNGIYNFTHLQYAQEQSKAACYLDQLIDVLCDKHQLLEKCSLFTSEQALNLQQALTNQKEQILCWYERYAAVIMYAADVDRIKLRVLGLEKWKLNANSTKCFANCTSYSEINCGYYLVSSNNNSLKEALDTLRNDIYKMLITSEQNTGNNRRSFGGNPGNQKTPGFLASVVKNACKGSFVFLPFSGTTDVGMHTGATLRSTSWPLACAVAQEACKTIPTMPQALNSLLLCYHATNLAVLSAHITTGIDCTLLMTGAAITILNAAAIEANVNIINNEIVAFFKNYRQQLEEVRELHRTKETVIDISVTSTQPVEVTIPSPTSINHRFAPSLLSDSIREVMSNNLAYPSSTSTLAEVRDWVAQRSCNTDSMQLIVLSTLETWICAIFLQNGQPICKHHGEHTVDDWLALQQRYEQISKGLAQTYCKNVHFLNTEFRSRTTIFTWVIWCFIHSCIVKQYPKFAEGAEYGVPINEYDTRHLVVKRSKLRKALLKVIQYVQKHAKPADCSPFNLAESSSITLSFFAHIAQSHPEADKNWEQILAERKRAIVEYKQTLVKKKEAAQRITNEICVAKERLNDLQIQRDNLDISQSYRAWRAADNSVAQKNKHVQKLQGELQRTLKAPKAIISQYPKDRDDALQIYYFHYPPNLVAQYIRITITAQALLSTQTYACDTKPVPFNWNHLPDIRTSLTLHDAISTTNCGPTDIEQIQSVRKQKIWYPTVTKLNKITVKGTNPFLATAADISATFTPNLVNNKELQSLLQLDSETDVSNRDNIAIANQELAAKVELSSLQFQFCAKIRAGAPQQLQQVLTLFATQPSTLKYPFVAAMVKMALYQMQYISEQQLVPCCQDDLENNNGYECVLKVFSQLYDEFQSKQREHPNLTMFAEVLSFLAADNKEIRNLSRKFSALPLQWAKQLNIACDNSKESQLLRRRKFLLQSYSILFHAAGQLTITDVSDILLALAQLRYGIDIAKEDQDLQNTYPIALEVVTTRLPQIISILHRDSNPLSVAASVFFETKLYGEWKQHKNTTCFTLETEQHVVAFNVQTGKLMLDGNPKSTLPATITSNEKYTEYFGGNMNFEVRRKNNIFETVFDPNRFYRFEMVGHDLTIEEVNTSTNLTLELLSRKCVNGWNVPDRLKCLYSHWVDRSNNIILFRPANCFTADKIEFLCQKQTETDIFHVVAVPKYLQTRPTREIVKDVGNYELLIQPPNELESAMGILYRIEKSQYIHVLKTKENAIRVELPRTGESFQLLNGKLFAEQRKGFFLANNQYLEGQLYNFDSYLILEHNTTKRKQILMVDGVVKKCSNAYVECNGVHADKAVVVHVVQLHHRFKTPICHSLDCRLQLVAIYAAASSFLPEKASNCTGTEIALDLIRKCFSSKPLTCNQTAKLRNIMEFTASEPALRILCEELQFHSNRLQCLFTDAHTRNADTEDLSTSNADTQYRLYEREWPFNFRRLLTSDERDSKFTELPLPKIPDALRNNMRSINDISANINYFYQNFGPYIVQDGQCSQKRFPITIEANDNSLVQSIKEVIRRSYKVFCDNNTKCNSAQPEIYAQMFIAQLEKVEKGRKKIEEFLLHSLDATNGNLKDKNWQLYCMYSYCNAVQNINCYDLLRITWKPNLIEQFNPFLDSESVAIIRERCFDWQQLCVLEDKLQRMICFCNAQDIGQLYVEITNEPCYDIKEYPKWLAFEVEQGLSIRKNQVGVAQHLIKNPGNLVQLNMGLGKTRVIVPLLLLHFAEKQLTRVTVLRELLDEAYDCYHNILTNSVFMKRIYLLPYHRENRLSLLQWEILFAVIKNCEKFHGFFLVTGEARQSLNLKKFDLIEEKENTAYHQLEKLLNYLYANCIDILDESDAILHFNMQLEYSIGKHCKLPNANARWLAIENVIERLSDPKTTLLSQLVNDEKLFKKQPQKIKGTFTRMRFLVDVAADNSCQLNKQISLIKQAIFMELKEHPPFELAWLSNIDERLAATIQKVICEELVDVASLVTKNDFAFEEHYAQVLAYRSLLAHGILFSSLNKRYSVDFGLRKGFRKQLAVPYRASNTPSERAEYAQPDVALALSVISHFTNGISRAQLKQAFEILIRRKESNLYQEWLQPLTASPTISRKKLSLIDTFAKLDLTNEHQVTLLHKFFQYSMKVISFWMNNCSFPNDTIQYPQHICNSAWDLATPNTIGFSGTKDHSILFPPQVLQSSPNLPEIDGTDGQMLNAIMTLANPEVIELASVDNIYDVIHQCRCKEPKINALIDAGGLITCQSNKEVASSLISITSATAALYFDTYEKEWMIKTDTYQWSRSNSPLKESECFAFFDQSRCRGANLKLAPDVIALITLGPKLGKDRLMQAIGRLRGLFTQNQTFQFIAPKEVISKITANNGKCDLLAVVNYLLHNTSQSISNGFTMWAKHGLHFVNCKEDEAKYHKLTENLELHEMYTTKAVAATLSESVNHLLGFQAPNEHSYLRSIRQRANLFSDVVVKQTAKLSECERELQKENETQQETQKMAPIKDPADALDWNVNKVPTCNTVTLLTDGCPRLKLFSLKEVANMLALSTVAWDYSPFPIYCTASFLHVVKQNTGISEYLRLIDHILCFPDKSMILLADKEANKIHQVLRQIPTNSTYIGPLLTKFVFLLQACANQKEKIYTTPIAMSLPTQVVLPISSQSLATLELFAGKTQFKENGRLQQLHNLLQSKESRSAVLRLLFMRRTSHLFDRSDVDAFYAASVVL